MSLYEVIIYHEFAPRNAIPVKRLLVEVDVDERRSANEFLYAQTRRVL